jgi:hypothetical protein
MAITFNAQQIALGKAMGLSNPNSQNDLNQINAFAQANGVNNLNSQNDLNSLLSKVTTPYETAPGSNQWVNPNNLLPNAGSYAGAPPVSGGLAGLPGAAANGSSSSMDLNALLMQQQASLAAQNQAFMQQQQQYAQQQAAQQAQMQQQLLAAQNAATPPGAATAGQATSGWTPNTAGRSTLESLLLGTQAVTGAMQMVVA